MNRFDAGRRFEAEKRAIASVETLLKAAMESKRLHDDAGMSYPEPLRRVLGMTPTPPAQPSAKERAAAIVAQPHPSERGVEKLPPSEVLGLFRAAAEQMRPEDDPGDPAFYRSAQTGVEPALPPSEPCATCGGTGEVQPPCFGMVGLQMGFDSTPQPCPDCTGRDGKGTR